MAIRSAGELIESGGLRAASIRKIAEAIGYTSGTLYQLFENLDALIVEVHIQTLEELSAKLPDVAFGGGPRRTLLDLSKVYAKFAKERRHRWNALLEHSGPSRDSMPERYDQAVMHLIGLGARAIAPMFPEGSEDRVFHEARVLWASLYGIVSLDASGRLSRFEDAESILDSLVTNQVAGLRARFANEAAPPPPGLPMQDHLP